MHQESSLEAVFHFGSFVALAILQQIQQKENPARSFYLRNLTLSKTSFLTKVD